MLSFPLVRTTLLTLGLVTVAASSPTSPEAVGQQSQARISETRRTIDTYPFSEANPTPIVARDERLYPYHSFGGYAHEAEPREWTVVHLENDWIEVWVLPEVGGKVWGARVKESGHEFIYRNEVMKFRNIALRGPWTSGGIEFNFGVVGHTPSTATPVDYVTRENDDGSVSVIVGTMDLPSRTHWRVEIRLPADAATFETRTLWTNPTVLEQPYYNWMTAAAFARDDLRMSIPGTAYLEHPGGFQTWPQDPAGRDLAVYDENRFGGNKSFHVVGRFDDFFGGYFESADYGFGHWSPYEEMPGQKLWLWALSRAGGIWDDLLTDTDGQYVEYQAGRLLVQYTPSGETNPISQVGFDPGRTDRWTESWFPLEGLGGLSDASRDGAVFVDHDGGGLRIRAQAFRAVDDTLRVTVDGVVVLEEPVSLGVLETVQRIVPPDGGVTSATRPDAEVLVELPGLGLAWHSAPDALALDRPFEPTDGAEATIPEVDRLVTSARQLVLGRRLAEARPLFERALRDEPWHREALLGLGDLEYRRGRYGRALEYGRRLLRLDAYDAEHNFLAGRAYRALGRLDDAAEAYGWAARSTAYRSVAYVELAEVALADGRPERADHYASLALDYDRSGLAALQLKAILARVAGDGSGAEALRGRLLEIDPLHHFAAAERYLSGPKGPAEERTLLSRFRSEFPEQELLELVIEYHERGRRTDALVLARLTSRTFPNPVVQAWAAWLAEDATVLPAAPDVRLAFPYRPETLAVLTWASDVGSHWGWSYLLALNLWGRDRASEAVQLLDAAGDRPDFGPFYAARSDLSAAIGSGAHDREADLRRAVSLEPGTRLLRLPLIQFLQEADRWEDAVAATADARRRFPDDFNLALLHVQSLNEIGRYRESIDILDEIRVLPSEHASMSHALFVAAHTMAALDRMSADPRAAVSHLRTAMTWPETLGQGRPYEPEERLQRYLLGTALEAAGDEAAAREAWAAVVDRTSADALDSGGWQGDPLDLLAVAALARMGRGGELRRFGVGASGASGRIAESIRRLAVAGEVTNEGLATVFIEAFAAEPSMFSGVEGRLLSRALAGAF